MPELPEVETIRSGLNQKILHKTITRFSVKKDRLVRNSKTELQKALLNNHITHIERVGKLLIFHLDTDQFLLVHLKMTGQLIYIIGSEIVAGGHSTQNLDVMPTKYSYVVFDFHDGSQLHFNDMRQFGYIRLVDKDEKEKVKSKFGLEPLTPNFTLKNFQNTLASRKGILKAVLLNQEILAGIGNIYADEICFRAKVKPNRRISTLSTREIGELYKACQYIIKKAIQSRGTTFSNYRDSANQKGNYVQYLKVYGRAHQPCLVCKKATIKKIKVAGRGTCYCPNCQK